MIEADAFIEQLRATGHTFVSGVPCSFLTPFINRVIDSPELDYLPAASEGEAVGINLGAYLAGRKTVTLCQNSGLGNTINPLTSLNYPFRVPSLLIVTWRGEPGIPDEPQHELMGRVTHQLLETIEIPVSAFPEEPGLIAGALQQLVQQMGSSGLPAALVMRKGSVQKVELETRFSGGHRVAEWWGQLEQPVPVAARPTRADAIQCVVDTAPANAAIIATTGKTGRELFTLADQPQNLYVVGGMGTASSIGLGVAVNAPQRPVIVIDGDGAALMKMGALATNGVYGPSNFIHVILDNEVHDSTGGQSTVSSSIRFAQIASGSNYRVVSEVATIDDFKSVLERMLQAEGPALVHLKVRPGSIDNLGRPTLSPVQVKERFMEFLQSEI